jgi:hypothetical protein
MLLRRSLSILKVLGFSKFSSRNVEFDSTTLIEKILCALVFFYVLDI